MWFMQVRRPWQLLVVLGAFACAGCSGSEDDITLQGAGATFPAPLYQRWFLEYYKSHPEVRVNYEEIGSGAGVRQFIAETIDFAASDAAMNDKEIGQVPRGVQLFPLTAGSVALSFNLPGGPPELRLSREAVVGIALGEIATWNHPTLVRDNPGAQLPEQDIVWIRRSEGSGTTFAFTNHLSTISARWKKGPGVGKSVVWPTGIGARGNNGVAALIEQTPGAIGYIESGYAELVHLPMAAVENKAGKFVKPTEDSAREALTSVKDLDKKFPRIWVTDPEGDASYPIVTYTWLCCYEHYKNPKVARTLTKVIHYCLTEGQKISASLGYVPLPEEVVQRNLAALERLAPVPESRNAFWQGLPTVPPGPTVSIPSRAAGIAPLQVVWRPSVESSGTVGDRATTEKTRWLGHETERKTR
jgi:phosphate transport system substrate-binding protein